MEIAEILKNLKKAMGAAGIICGIAGIIATLVIYFVLSPIIDRLGATAILTMDHAEAAVGGGAASLDSASNSISSISNFSGNMSASIMKLENGSIKFSYALSNLSKNLGVLNQSAQGNSLQQLNDSASAFLDFSTSLEGVRSSISNLSSNMDEMSSHIKSTKDSIASAEVDISDAKDSINQLVGGLKLTLLVGTFIGILVFLTLICYSVGILL